MKFLKYLQEEFVTSFKSEYGGMYTEVFVNPSSKEMKAACESGVISNNFFRFTAMYNSKKLYIFNPDVIHDEAMTKLRIDLWPRRNPPLHFSGIAILKGNIAYYHSSDWLMSPGLFAGEIKKLSMNKDVVNWAVHLVYADWSWAENYIQGLNKALLPYRKVLKNINIDNYKWDKNVKIKK